MRGIALLVACLLLSPGLAAAQGKATSLYPRVTQSEDHISQLETLEETGPAARAALVAAVTDAQLTRGYPPQAALVLVGPNADELAIVALHSGALATPFQARAYLDQLAAVLRTLPAYAKEGVDPRYTTLDLLKLYGFRQVSVSDGDTFTIRVNLF